MINLKMHGDSGFMTLNNIALQNSMNAQFAVIDKKSTGVNSH